MVTTRSLRAEKRTAAKALGGSVLTNKVRFTRLETSEQQPTPVLRELMYHKNRLQHQVENLQDLGITQAATIKDLTDEIEKKDEDIATLKSVIQNLTRDNDELDKQNQLIGKVYEDIMNEQKQLLAAVNNAGYVLAMATRAQNVVM
jgi:chromosome segregation ATPase